MSRLFGSFLVYCLPFNLTNFSLINNFISFADLISLPLGLYVQGETLTLAPVAGTSSAVMALTEAYEMTTQLLGIQGGVHEQ